MAKSFLATLKTEFYYRGVWTIRAGASRAVGAWIEDRYRRHSSIGQISPRRLRDATLQPHRGRPSSRITPVSTVRGQGH